MQTHRRAGVSDLVATVLVIAMTLIAGAALFGYVNGQASIAENNLGTAVAGTANFLREKFTVPEMSVSQCNPPSYCVTLWLYNNGEISLQLQWIHVYNGTDQNPKTAAKVDVTFTRTSVVSGNCVSGTNTLSTVNLAALSTPCQLILTLPSGTFTTGTVYYADILALYGNTVVSYAVK